MTGKILGVACVTIVAGVLGCSQAKAHQILEQQAALSRRTGQSGRCPHPQLIILSIGKLP